MAEHMPPQGPKALEAELERAKRNAQRRSRNPFSMDSHHDDTPNPDADYLYRRGELLCDEADEARVRAQLERMGTRFDVRDHSVPGLLVLTVDESEDLPALCAALGSALGDDEVVTPNHVLNAQGFPYVCPATEPLPWYVANGATGTPWPALAGPEGAGKVKVAVIDTGFLKDYEKDKRFPWLAGVGPYQVDDDAYYPAPPEVAPYGGHGTFATGVLRATAGIGVPVIVRDCLLGGVVDEVTIIEDLIAVLEMGVDIVTIQAGLYSRGNHRPKAFEAFRRNVLPRYPAVVFVAAAGNESSDVPFWPAAYDWVVSVGALTHGGDARTAWTNYGNWVDVYAPGEGVVNAWCDGGGQGAASYTYLDGTKATFASAMACWSGTSFAAPFVAGLIARRVVERNVPALQARNQLLWEATRAALQWTGPRLMP